MSKTFLQFREELNNILPEEIYFEDLDNDVLQYIITEDEFELEDKVNAVLTLFERGELELTEEELEELTEDSNSNNVLDNALQGPQLSSTKLLRKYNDLPDVNVPVSTKSTHPLNIPNPGKLNIFKQTDSIPKVTAIPVTQAAKPSNIKKYNDLPDVTNTTDKKMHPLNIPNKFNQTDSTPKVSTPSQAAKPVTQTSSVTDNTKNMTLTGKKFDSISTALSGPEPTSKVNQKLIGPMGGAKSVTSTPSQAANPVAKTPVKSPVATQAKLIAKAPAVASIQRKALPKAPVSKPEADPNAGGFKAARTTATASKLNTGQIGNFRNVIKGLKRDASLSPTPKGLAPQGSAKRDSQLAAQGYKKF